MQSAVGVNYTNSRARARACVFCSGRYSRVYVPKMHSL